MTPLFAIGPECCMFPPLLAAGLVYYLLASKETPPEPPADPDAPPRNWPDHWPR